MNPTTTETWTSSDSLTLNAATLEDLLNNKIGAIRVRSLATPLECQALVSQIDAIGWDYYKNVTPPIGKFGVTQFEHRNGEKAEYFRRAAGVREKLSRVPLHAELIGRVQAAIRRAGTAVDIATEGTDQYFAGLVRHIDVALLHLDFAPLDGPTWSIGKISRQLTWNIYLQPGDSGGDCQVYNRQWRPEDEQTRVPGSYGYDPKLVADVQSVRLRPNLGELTLFNSRNFHEVHASAGRRITLSSFAGLIQPDRLVLWS
jgi:hypothetical protein